MGSHIFLSILAMGTLRSVDLSIDPFVISQKLKLTTYLQRGISVQRADTILDELKQSGVHINDEGREWRADGEKSFPRTQSPNAKNGYKIPRMKDCQTIDEAIKAIHDNVEKVSPRDISAFRTVVPQFLKTHGGNKQQDSCQQDPQLTTIFNKTAEKLGKFGPRDLATTALVFAKIVNILGEAKRRSHIRGSFMNF